MYNFNVFFSYADLQLDFQFTFNLSKKEDRHIRQINFRNVPLKPDLDLEFSVHCSTLAKLNISVRSIKVCMLKREKRLWRCLMWLSSGICIYYNQADEDIDEEKFILMNYNCTTFKTRFPRSEYHFGGEENTTFYVYVYDFRSPIWITVNGVFVYLMFSSVKNVSNNLFALYLFAGVVQSTS